jgi:hypothetical protein
MQVLKKITKFHWQEKFYMRMGLSLRWLCKSGRYVNKTASERALLWRWEAVETICIRVTHTGSTIYGPEKVRCV